VSESPIALPSMLANCYSKNKIERPLRNEWQRRRLNLEVFCPAVQFMADAVQDWCMNLARNGKDGRCIVLTGPFGLGKTECLRAAAKYTRDVRMAIWPEPWPRPLQFLSVNWADFIREQVENDNHEQMEDLTQSDVVFLDDIGSEEDRFKSGSPARILGDVLGKMERKFIFITTNIDPVNSGWAKRWDGRVEDRLLRARSTVINLWQPELEAESYAVWRLRQ
jgi:DNA replication protein DnaC